ncbi:MATE family multidrug exporter [Paenibacillus montaniterrae]|uniref:Probable multidrug resistance protein NorM n=1 Tax=Paenibacillus montaniterrae TaxID=429341 RepID=A0A919YNI1_9BACL|nr:MATE family efflux transporter [Paenibacillus montaniterrae]GIP16437.1 MATE family multidrug exporter [Paenibacillus montaniterrae]
MKLTSSMKMSAASFVNRYFSGKSISAKQIFSLIIPIFVDSAFIVLISILNTAMISTSGVAAVSAVSVVDSLNIFIVSLFIAIATGGTVIVAQYTGSRNPQQASNAAAQAISAVAALSLALCILIILFHSQLLGLLFGSAEADVFENAKLFLIGSSISYPFFAVYQAVVGVLRGVSETKACLMLSVILNLTYFLLNILFVAVFDMGVVGLAISYIAARILGAAAALFYLFKINHTLHVQLRDLLKLKFSLLKKIMFIGIPFAAEQMFFNGGKLLTQAFIVQLGTLSITVNAISNSLSMLFQIGGSTLSVAIVTVVGQCIGRREIDDARKFIRSFLWLSSLFFVFITIVLLAMFPLLVGLYSPPDEIVPSIFELILLISIAQPLVWSISFVLPSALRAAGDSTFTSISSLLSMWLFRIGVGYVLGIMLQMGVMGIWIAMVAEWGVRGLIFYLRFRGDKWYQHKLV